MSHPVVFGWDTYQIDIFEGDLLRASGERSEGAEPLLEHHRGGFPRRRRATQKAALHRHKQV